MVGDLPAPFLERSIGGGEVNMRRRGTKLSAGETEKEKLQ